MTEAQNSLKRVLELAAEEIEARVHPGIPGGCSHELSGICPGKSWFESVLEKRLGPLLEAGKRARGSCDLEGFDDTVMDYDMALEQALKE